MSEYIETYEDANMYLVKGWSEDAMLYMEGLLIPRITWFNKSMQELHGRERKKAQKELRFACTTIRDIQAVRAERRREQTDADV